MRFRCVTRSRPVGYAAWPEFDAEVLGGHYTGHHANDLGPTIWTLPAAKESPIARGLPASEFVSQSSLYKTSPLAKSAAPLMMGRVAGEKLEEPVTWTNTTRHGGRVFYTSLGGPEDFAMPQFRRLLTNGVFWALGSRRRTTPPIKQRRRQVDPAPLSAADEVFATRGESLATGPCRGHKSARAATISGVPSCGTRNARWSRRLRRSVRVLRPSRSKR